MVGRQHRLIRFLAVSQRGTSYVEALVIIAIVCVMVGAVVIPGYRNFMRARAPAHAASTLAEDLALLERAAQNGRPHEGSSLVVVSADPFVYRCYRGRPASVDPNSTLGALLIERRFPGVTLASGPIGLATPLLFASNGSAQYQSGGVIADQHATVGFSLTQSSGRATANVTLNLFTGAISAR
ncbi:MAG TPA: hypothetical protein VGQ96_04060 [Candidatus Eremiobacteraceae bacterium]|nr:hypothetical protein [Candidatus Eremiobacteraceae bacterium]